METFQSVKTYQTDSEVTQIEQNNEQDELTEQVEKFDNTYSDTKLKELTDSFDSITIDEDVLKSVTIQQKNAIEHENISFRTKLFLATSIAITALLLFLAIYNIFRINQVSSSIDLLQNNITTETTIYESIRNDIANLKDVSNIENELQSMGYSEIANADMTYIELPEASEVTVLTGSTNWFDSVCNFISSIFGG